MECIDKYLQDVAKELAENYLLDSEDGVLVDRIMMLARGKSDELEEIIVSNIYEILEENDITIYE